MWKGKTAIVTGASGGIGSVLCRALSERGLNLVLAGRSREKLEKVRESLPPESAGRTVICPGDIRQLSYAEELLEKADAQFGGLDLLINCAGLAHRCPAQEMTPQLFDQIMETNVKAPYFLCQKALPYLRRSECATIINICSVVAHKGYPLQSVYAASKHALLGWSKSLANEVYGENIRVHVISPGAVFTDMIAVARPDLSPEGMILPEDIAAVVGFYLDRRSSCGVVDEIELHRSNKEPFA